VDARLRGFVALIVFALTLLLVLEPPPAGPAPEKEGGPEAEGPLVRVGDGLMKSTEAMEALRWYNDQRAYPTGRIPVDWRQKALAHAETYNLGKRNSLESIAWTSVGPTNIAGRVRSIAIDPRNSNVMYSGSVSGGLWKSTNGGAGWLPITDFVPNMVIGCLALDPKHPDTLYAGTGEGYFNVDALRGTGVLKSTDAGQSWSVLTTFIGSTDTVYSYRYINKLVIRPDDPSILFAAVSDRGAGLWKSINSGVSWTRIQSPGTKTKFCTDLVMDVLHPDTMYAAFGLFTADGIYRTTNGGTTWVRLAGGFPMDTENFRRISLAISPSNPSVLYASLADGSYYTYGIYKTTDCGNHWSQVGIPYDNSPAVGNTHLGGQGWYNNVIAVHPQDPQIVYAGGINLFRSTDGGANWARISDGYSTPYVHVDQHAICFDPANPSLMYFGNDGGMFKSTDGGTSFSDINTGLVTAQFYSGAAHPTAEVYYGGTQDNGTIKTGSLPGWTQVLGGDGGATEVDVQNPSTVYTEYVYLCFQKSVDAGLTWQKMMNGIPQKGSNVNQGTSDRCLFIAPVVMDPSNPQILAAGTFRLFSTTNGGGSWTSISQSLPNNGDMTGDGDGASQVGSHGGAISAIAIAKSSSPTIYVGTSGGVSANAYPRVWVTTNSGTDWSDVTRPPLPVRYVSAIAVDPASRDKAYVCYSGFGTGHVYATSNRGLTWQDASGNLPDVPVNALVVDPMNPGHLIAGTDAGIFESIDAGTAWVRQNAGMGNVSVDDVDLRQDGYVIAATHGRGMFKSTRPAWMASRLGISVLQNPQLTRYIDIFVTALDSLTTPPVLTISMSGGMQQDLTLDTLSYRMYKGSFELAASGSVTLSVSATDSAGQPVSASRTFQAQIVLAGAAGILRSDGGGCSLEIPAGAVFEDTYFTLLPDEGGSPPRTGLLGRSYWCGPAREFSQELLIAFPYSFGGDGPDERFLSVFRQTDTGWAAIPSQVDPLRHVVSARIRQLGRFALGILSTAGAPGQVPSGYALSQNYPNPFNPETRIRFALPERARVTLTVYALSGQRVATLVEGERDAGTYEVLWDAARSGQAVASGIYFYRVVAELHGALKYQASGKMVVLK
jgi:photosystem II stability/assembly factor-like uncharacterized protein